MREMIVSVKCSLFLLVLRINGQNSVSLDYREHVEVSRETVLNGKINISIFSA